jgi:hypothetical protein
MFQFPTFEAFRLVNFGQMPMTEAFTRFVELRKSSQQPLVAVFIDQATQKHGLLTVELVKSLNVEALMARYGITLQCVAQQPLAYIATEPLNPQLVKTFRTVIAEQIVTPLCQVSIAQFGQQLQVPEPIIKANGHLVIVNGQMPLPLCFDFLPVNRTDVVLLVHDTSKGEVIGYTRGTEELVHATDVEPMSIQIDPAFGLSMFRFPRVTSLSYLNERIVGPIEKHLKARFEGQPMAEDVVQPGQAIAPTEQLTTVQ